MLMSMLSGVEPWQRFFGTTLQALMSIGREDVVLFNGWRGYHAVDYSRIDVDLFAASVALIVGRATETELLAPG